VTVPDTAADRLARSPELGTDELARLGGAEVAIAGLGVLGGPVCHHLAMLGVPMILIDDDVVSEENLANQGFPARSVGEPKAAVRARQVRELNPACQVRPVQGRIEDLGFAALAGCSLIVTAIDNVGGRVRTAEIATRLGVPMLDCACDGSGHLLFGTVSAFHAGDTSPCFACIYPSHALQAKVRDEQPDNCGSREPGRPVTGPTLQCSGFGAVVSGFAAQWAVRLLTGRGDELIGRRLTISATATPPGMRMLPVAVRPDCVIGHRRFEPLHVDRSGTVAATVAAAEATLGAPVDEARLHGRTLAATLTCGVCGARREDVWRATTRISPAEGRCPSCKDRQMDALTPVDTLDRTAIEQVAGREWDDLSLPRCELVSFRAGSEIAHFIVNDASDHPAVAAGEETIA